MFLKDELVQELVTDLNSGDEDRQCSACQHVRDLCSNSSHYCQSLAANGVIPSLCGLLDESARRTAALAVQALYYLTDREEDLMQIRDSGGLDNIVELLRKDKEVSEVTLENALKTLQHVAGHLKLREYLSAAGAMQAVIKLLSNLHCEEVVVAAVQLMQCFAYDMDMQDKIRANGGLTLIIRKLSSPSVERSVLRACLNCVAVLTAGNAPCQDEVRVMNGLPPMLQVLQLSPYDATTCAAADALRATCQGNEANKDTVRKEWGIPLLVQLLGPSVPRDLVERAIDCLRILTSHSNDNKGALMNCNSALQYLLTLIDDDETTPVLMERTAAVLANLTSMTDHYGSLREGGVVQKLVRLLEQGPESRVTQHAVVALANLVQDPHTRKSVRLAGGVPPLIQLMLETADRQLQSSCELALERLGVTDVERNAILDAFRFSDARHQRMNVVSLQLNVQPEDQTDARRRIGPKPLPRYSPEDVVVLLRNLCVDKVELIQASGITGGELLELIDSELKDELGWSALQVKKVQLLRRAYLSFSQVAMLPGVGEVTFLEVQKYLEALGIRATDVTAILDGLRSFCLDASKGTLTFQDFVCSFLWLQHSLEALKAKYDMHPDIKAQDVAKLKQTMASVCNITATT